jgi:hypothetical protein
MFRSRSNLPRSSQIQSNGVGREISHTAMGERRGGSYGTQTRGHHGQVEEEGGAGADVLEGGGAPLLI